MLSSHPEHPAALPPRSTSLLHLAMGRGLGAVLTPPCRCALLTPLCICALLTPPYIRALPTPPCRRQRTSR